MTDISILNTFLITKYGNKYSGVWYNVAYQRRQSNLERIGCPRSACYESLFFVRAQRAHPVNRRVGRWALFQMTKIRTTEMITINLEKCVWK